MQRELTYQVSYERLAKLSWSASRKAYGTVWLLTGLVLAALAAVALARGFYDADIGRWMKHAGIPFSTDVLFLPCLPLFVVGLWLIGKIGVRQAKRRANYDDIVHLTQDEGGLRFATVSIEYYLKWQGIAQLLVEKDGVAVSHGNLFWFVPDTAFESAEERRAFIRGVYGRLSEKARAISEKHVRAELAG